MAETLENRTIAPPGCGKTTWVSRQSARAARMGKRVAAFSLTVAAAEEIAGRDFGEMEPGSGEIVTGTLHSQCYRAMGFPEMAESPKHLGGWNERVKPEWQLTPARGKDGEEEPVDGQPKGAGGDALMSRIRQLRGSMVPEEEWEPAAQEMQQHWREWKQSERLMDFTDLIEGSLYNTVEAPSKPDVILVDECQDMDWLEMSLIRHWGQAAGRLVTVGDPDQCLYGWRGSDPDAFAGTKLPDGHERVLARSYRLPREVHAKAMEWIDRDTTRRRVEYHPKDEEGQVRSVRHNWQTPEGLLEDAEQYLTEGKSVMFLASCGYMIEPLVERLRKEGIPFHNPLRPQQGAWNPMRVREGAVSAAQRLAAFLKLSEQGAWNAEDMRRWTAVARVKEIIDGKGGRRTLDALEDDAVGPDNEPELSRERLAQLMLPEALEAGETGDIEWYRRRLTAARVKGMEFPLEMVRRSDNTGARRMDALEQEPLVIPGTIHSAKGGEADVVYLIPDLSKQGAEEWYGAPKQKAGIYRMFYVGMTRAKETLVLCQQHRNSEAPELDY